MKNISIRQGLAFGILVLLIGTTIPSLTGTILRERNTSIQPHIAVSLRDIPILELEKGTYGTYTEYISKRENKPFLIQKISGSQKKDRSNTPLIVIFVNTNLVPYIEKELTTYVSTLNTVGYTTVLLQASGGTVEDLKNQLLSYWTNPSYNLTGAVIIGDLPVAWYYHRNDYEGEDAEFPCDLFLMDLDGQWIYNPSLGMYDNHLPGSGDTAPEIYLGRIDASNTPGNEIEITRRYLQKVHEFWIGNITHSDRALTYTDHDWAPYSDFRHDIGYAYSNYDAVWWPDVNRDDYVYNRLPNTYEFIQIACHAGGMTTRHNFTIGGAAYSDDVRYAPPMALFYNIFTCSSLRFTDYNCLGNGYVLNTTSPSFTAVGSTKIGSMLDFRYFYEPIGQGYSFGGAFQKWFEYEAPYDENDISWFYGMVILGDPTLIPNLEFIPPQWRNQGQNKTEIQRGESISLYAQGKDNNALVYASLATNETGAWENITSLYGSPMNLGGVQNQWVWSNFTWQNPAILQGKTIGWRIYYTDRYGNVNATDIRSFYISKNPIIHDYTNILADTGASFTFNTSMYDDDGIDVAYVEYWYNDGEHFNETLTPTDRNGLYQKTIVISPTATILHYIISAKDNTDLWSSTEEKSVQLVDIITPDWRNQGQSAHTILPGGTISLFTQGKDNIALNWAWLATNENGNWEIFSGKNWWNRSWEYCKPIIIDHTKVDADLLDFPVLITGTSSDFTAHAQANGYDFVFVNAANTTRYSHEIENFNSATGELTAWVNIPFLSSTQDTTLYIYYGNPICENQENKNGTWGSNYSMVHHMTGASALQLKDSTANHWDVTSSGGNPTYNQQGKVGKCVDFDGSGSYLQASGFRLPTDSSYTGGAWVYVDGNAGTRRYAFEGVSANLAISLLVWTNETFKNYAKTSGGTTSLYSTTKVNVNTPQWYYICTRADATTDRLDIFVNGASEASTAIVGAINSETQGLNIGTYRSANMYWMNGKIDEIRISNIARSNSWIKTEYNNIAFPSVFVTVGEETQRGGGSKYGSPLPLNGITNQWMWSNFTWQNPEISEGRKIGWRIYYFDSSNNEIATDIMNFTVGTQTIPNPPITPADVTAWHTDPNDLNKGIGAKGMQYTYSSSSTAGNDLYFEFFWGDGNNSGWIGPYNSGQMVTASHAYVIGTFGITAVVKIGISGTPSNPSPARSVRMFKLGDCTGDDWVTFADIDPFVIALNGKTLFYAAHPVLYWFTADCQMDTMVTIADIDLFVAVIGT